MARAALSLGAGIGLREPHHDEVLARRPALAFVEVHSENFFADGGPALAVLERVRTLYPLSLHGVGLSLGSADPLDERHLAKLEGLVRRFEPALVSEHLSWSSIDGRHANDLLPLPHTLEAAAHVAGRIAAVQERLGRRILVENVSRYLDFEDSRMPEWEFVMEVVRRSGCLLLLDVNNVHVNAANHGFDAHRYLAAIDPACVAQYHLGGHEAGAFGLVDTHAAKVAPAVWSLFRESLARIGPRPTLVEWDAALPALDVLLDEACSAEAALREASAARAAGALP
ncbi:MAG TPA: DUF692 domain-containing protein [Usitatibacter sp.]|nr:DUF692 domain-containing protein [Usitatibacter sp.]